MSLRSKLISLLGIPVVLLIATAGFSRWSIGQLTVGGLVADKDLIADILPPPTYLIEAYSVTLQMVDDTNRPRLAELETRFGDLRKDFDQREHYWDASLPPGPVHEALTAADRPAREFLDQWAHQLTPLLRQGKYSEARALAFGAMSSKYQEHRAAIDRLVELATDQANRDQRAADSLIRLNSMLSVVIPCAALALLAALGFFVLQNVSRCLREVADEIENRSREVAAAAAQTANSSQTLAQGASEQASSLEETSASLEEMASMTSLSAEHGETAKQLAVQTRTTAERAAEAMVRMKQAMDDVKVSSEGISAIIKTIDEIAFQTNILALNAAVEAARAGEAGAGFAIVAEEVRALAQRSANAARETAPKIEDSVRKSEQGVTISSDVGAGLATMVEKARELDKIVAEITHAAHEQSQGIAQVTTALAQMDQVTQSNAAGAEEGASAAEELNTQAGAMRDAVARLQALVYGAIAPREVPPAEGLRAAGRDRSTRVATNQRVGPRARRAPIDSATTPNP